jgi:hypothetical protein
MLIPHATIMPVFNIRDIGKETVTTALKRCRARIHQEDAPQSILDEVFGRLGSPHLPQSGC